MDFPFLFPAVRCLVLNYAEGLYFSVQASGVQRWGTDACGEPLMSGQKERHEVREITQLRVKTSSGGKFSFWAMLCSMQNLSPLTRD